MRRPELTPARGRSTHVDQADATRRGLIGGSRLSVVITATKDSGEPGGED